MPGDLQTIMDAAEQAAASNDFPSAARHLRDAATLQESALGAAHPDLANTLNNLGVVCERIGEIDEAERCFRRAYVIATTALPSEHPFVSTSRENLEEFCRLHSRSVEQDFLSEHDDDDRAEATQDDAGSIKQDPEAGSIEQDPAYERSEPPREAAPRAEGAPHARSEPHREAVPVELSERAIPLGAFVGAAIGILVMIGWMAWPSRTVSDPPRTETGDATPPAVPSPSPEPPKPEPTPPPAVDTKPAPPSTQATAPPTSTDSPTVVDARVCRSLETTGAWQCDAVTATVAPGPIYFFTRIAADRDTTVQHRWYFGDELRQSVMLSIQATSAGYRTFSRTTIAPERTGEWRVELRAEDGRVLREERFTVR